MTNNFESWGRIPRVRHEDTLRPCSLDDIPPLRSLTHPLLAVGLGRSYGDSCLNENGTLLDMTGVSKIYAFDAEGGTVRCEAGCSLQQVLAETVPKGWFLPVVPGTKFVTVGGAIANDIHGKNHHRAGTFGCHVLQFELLRSDGTKLICSPERNRPLFEATIGGLGLTGLILWAEIRLMRIRSGRIEAENLRFNNIDRFFELAESSDTDFEYTVAWIDCMAKGRNLGRGIFMRGNHSESEEQTCAEDFSRARLGIPCDAPEFLLNPLTVKLFNQAYFYKELFRNREATVPFNSFFFPLDSVENWNRIYGKRGFFQYQCVVPCSDGYDTITRVLERIVQSGNASFLGVLKTFGEVMSPGLLSFPRPGVTLALDFANMGERTLRLFHDLDDIVQSAGGALYPCKDARMSPEMFTSGFRGLGTFRNHIDPLFSSSFWRRVMPT